MPALPRLSLDLGKGDGVSWKHGSHCVNGNVWIVFRASTGVDQTFAFIADHFIEDVATGVGK